MEDTLITLKNNSIATIVHKNSENKYLVCKHNFSNDELSLPMAKIDVINDPNYTEKLITMMEQEFGIINTGLTVINTNRISYLKFNEYVIGNNIGFVTKELASYKGMREANLMQTGYYTEVSYKSLQEIETLFNSGSFDVNAYYFINELKTRGGTK